jgi:hypothetical protein
VGPQAAPWLLDEEFELRPRVLNSPFQNDPTGLIRHLESLLSWGKALLIWRAQIEAVYVHKGQS